jgi:hypothetical protein
MAAFFLNVP